jgi:diguanylate cyclase (GGDEF)-like protein/PAS domain S-box-containing protein
MFALALVSAEPPHMVLEVNEAFAAIVGQRVSYCLGKPITSLLGADADPMEARRLMACLAAGEMACISLVMRSDGRVTRRLEMLLQPSAAFTDRDCPMIVTCVEHSHAAEPTLYGNLEIRRDSAGEIVISHADPNACSILEAGISGARHENVLFDRLALSERRHLEFAVRRSLEDGQTRRADLRGPGLSHERRHFRLDVTPTSDASTFTATLCDVTDEMRRSESERIFELAIVNANDAVLVTDSEPLEPPGPIITYANDAVTEHSDWEVDELIGNTPRMLQGPETDPADIRMMAINLRRWRRFEIQILNYRKDGRPFWNEISLVPLRGPNGWYRHWVSIQRNITLRKRQERLAAKALHDPLTGLANRELVARRVSDSITDARRQDREIGILVFDLDFFKQINDRFGHAAGDRVLIDTANRLVAELGDQGSAGRLGGDEFVVVIPHIEDAAALEACARRLQRRIAEPIEYGMHRLYVSATFGAALHAEAGNDGTSLIRAADLALTHAKRSGRKSVQLFDERLRREVEIQREAERDMRKSLESFDFDVDFQPQIRPHDGGVSGCEVLLRWNHPQRGRLAAGSFLDLALNSRLMEPLGALVLERAVAAATAWGRSDLDFGTIAINVDTVQLADPDFASQFLARIDNAGISRDHMAIEVVERVFLGDQNPHILTNLNALQSAGIALDLDDFGTGHASLTHLRSLELRRIKIDKSFVHNATTDAADRAIIRAIIDLARTLGREVVAEGVETTEQWQLLADAGCHHIQGYHVSRPMTEAAMTDWLKLHKFGQHDEHVHVVH